MRKITVGIFSFLFLLSSSWGASVKDRRNDLLKVLNEEQQEIQRLSRQFQNRNPELLLRIAQIHMDKARILREIETEKYLEIDAAKRGGINKQKLYAQSHGHVLQAQKLCKQIVSRFPQFKDKADVYFIMAYNATELGNVKQARTYYNQASRYSKKVSETKIKANLALANLHYNDARYAAAIPLYEESLRAKKDQWWTKDAFNLAWCYFRTKRYDNAIRQMESIYKLSKSNKFIDMSQGVVRDLALFFAEAGKIKDGVRFYESIGENIAKHLILMSKRMIAEGKYTKAQTAVEEGLRAAKTTEEKVAFHTLSLELYGKYMKVGSHYKSAKVLFPYYKQNKLDDDQLTRYRYEVQRMGALLQKDVLKKSTQQVKKTREYKAQMAGEYFELMSQIDPKQSVKMMYLKGETLYYARMYRSALDAYDKSYILAQKEGDKKFQMDSVKGEMACLVKNALSGKEKDDYYLKSYERYLSLDNRSDKANQIYQNLFKIHEDRGDIAKYTDILERYHKDFPQESKKQEIMLASVMEYYNKRNDHAAIRNWIQRINRKEFTVSAKYAAKLKQLLTSMQMGEAQLAQTRGEKAKALQGFVKAANDPESTAKARKTSTHNVAILYYELGAVQEMYDWTQKSIALLSTGELLAFEDTYLLISAELFNRDRYDLSIQLSETIFNQLCATSHKRKDQIFKNVVYMKLAQGQTDQALSFIDTGVRCKVPADSILDGKLETLEAYKEQKNMNAFEKLLRHLQYAYQKEPRLIEHQHLLYQEMLKNSDQRSAAFWRASLEKQYQNARRSKTIPLEALEIIASFEIPKLELQVSALKSSKLSFPENIYNAGLQKKFQQLDGITNAAVRIAQLGSGDGTIYAYTLLLDAYESLANEVKDFTPPQKSKEYVVSFKKNMDQVVRPLLAKAAEFKAIAKKEVIRNQILSHHSVNFLGNERSPVPVQYSYYKQGIYMDRGGQR